MSSHTLRPYQNDAIDGIQNYYRQGIKKVLLHLETGGGKTTIFCEIMKRAVAKGKSAIMVVAGRKLVNQASQRLFREGVYHGVLMANHYLHKPAAPIQICSIDTLNSRSLRPSADLIVVDEAHEAISPRFTNFFLYYPDSYFLPVTATPYTNKSLRHMADAVVRPTDFDELVANGFLVPPRYWCPHVPDDKGIKTKATLDGRDYVQTEAAKAMDRGDLIADIVTQWKQKGEGRATICFGSSITHSKNITEAFNKAGIPAIHIDANSTQSEREEAIRLTEEGKNKILCNYGILITGVDIPCVGCIILGRMTKSYNTYIQMCGRGTRPFPGKKDFIILDHAGNVLRHGFINQTRDANLEAEKFNLKLPAITRCKMCMVPFEGRECPNCGWEKPIAEKASPREILTVAGDLKELTDYTPEMYRDYLKIEAKQKGYSKGWIYHKLAEKFGEMTAGLLMPRRNRRRSPLFVSKEQLENVRF